jgi:murein L,D-transpeptidase YafK
MQLARILLGIWLGFAGVTATAAEVWVKIDTQAQTLAVMQGDKRQYFFDSVALGRGGVGKDRRRGDGKTPLGEFHITRVNWSSPFLIFFGLDFPLPEHADRALKAGKIDPATYEAILTAHTQGTIPPQDTPLGGQIGLHGLGRASLKIHKQANWTQGCVALTNSEIRKLASLVQVGTRVVIE